MVLKRIGPCAEADGAKLPKLNYSEETMLAQLANSELFESEPGSATCEMVLATLEDIPCAGGVEGIVKLGAQSNINLVGLGRKDHAW